MLAENVDDIGGTAARPDRGVEEAWKRLRELDRHRGAGGAVGADLDQAMLGERLPLRRAGHDVRGDISRSVPLDEARAGPPGGDHGIGGGRLAPEKTEGR